MFKLGCSCHETNEDYCGHGLCLPKSIRWLKPRQLPEGMLTARDRASEALKQATGQEAWHCAVLTQISCLGLLWEAAEKAELTRVLPWPGERLFLQPFQLLGNAWARELVWMTVNSLARVEETVQTCQAMRNVRAARRAVPWHIWARLVAGKETRWGCQEPW